MVASKMSRAPRTSDGAKPSLQLSNSAAGRSVVVEELIPCRPRRGLQESFAGAIVRSTECPARPFRRGGKWRWNVPAGHVLRVRRGLRGPVRPRRWRQGQAPSRHTVRRRDTQRPSSFRRSWRTIIHRSPRPPWCARRSRAHYGQRCPSPSAQPSITIYVRSGLVRAIRLLPPGDHKRASTDRRGAPAERPENPRYFANFGFRQRRGEHPDSARGRASTVERPLGVDQLREPRPRERSPPDAGMGRGPMVAGRACDRTSLSSGGYAFVGRLLLQDTRIQGSFRSSPDGRVLCSHRRPAARCLSLRFLRLGAVIGVLATEMTSSITTRRFNALRSEAVPFRPEIARRDNPLSLLVVECRVQLTHVAQDFPAGATRSSHPLQHTASTVTSWDRRDLRHRASVQLERGGS